MTKRAMFVLLLVAAMLSAAAAVGATPSGQSGPTHVIVTAPEGQPAAPPPPIVSAPAQPAASGPVQFSSDFSSADLSAWQGQPWLQGDEPASWRVIAGRLQ